MQLTIDHVVKRYGDQWALRDISLCCGPGMLGLIGPNGAGKTTLMRIIATLLPPTSGHVYWENQGRRADGPAIRRVLGYLPQSFGLYPEFTARQLLRYLAELKGLPSRLAQHRADEVLELVNLEGDADRRLHGYSGGMQRRVGIAQALLNDPELLIVDEPTAGLDPAERVRFRTLLASLTTDRLVILSTHIIGDVEAVANRLLVLREGQLVVDTTPEELLARATGQVWSVTVDPRTALKLQAAHQVSAMITQPGGVMLRIASTLQPINGAVTLEPTLEDAYLLAIGSAGSSAGMQLAHE